MRNIILALFFGGLLGSAHLEIAFAHDKVGVLDKPKKLMFAHDGVVNSDPQFREEARVEAYEKEFDRIVKRKSYSNTEKSKAQKIALGYILPAAIGLAVMASLDLMPLILSGGATALPLSPGNRVAFYSAGALVPALLIGTTNFAEITYNE